MAAHNWFDSTMPAAGLKAFLRHDAVNGSQTFSIPARNTQDLTAVGTLDVDDTVTITSENGADAANLVWTENQVGYLTRVEATGDVGSGIAYSIVGARTPPGSRSTRSRARSASPGTRIPTMRRPPMRTGTIATKSWLPPATVWTATNRR
ncbi:hypothetical protein PIB19_03235 [Sphingomonas sp. 7/4-4]|uniref:hypothetical protein n=1 Tax=Sphingomonas sp. 7/4-4 TaxID=3018446 RepID=UPI0022F3C5F4|nr:hypothetical protein [Sphingomonas sp. 7/4-4]WBY08517.1 hypothetical protein PIB19_03235 [Sphingomonas sp. 7/4-4]